MSDVTVYHFKCGSTCRREEGETPNGNAMNGRWVLRDAQNKLVDFDQYRSDLFERNRLVVTEDLTDFYKEPR